MSIARRSEVRERSRRDPRDRAAVCHRTSSDVVVLSSALANVVTGGGDYELARYRAVISRRRNGKLCRLGKMGNLAMLLVKFGAAFLLACHVDYTLAQDNATGKRTSSCFPCLA